jgi:prohibitin 2
MLSKDVDKYLGCEGCGKRIKNKKIQEQKYLTLLEVTKQKNEELIQAEINKNIAIEQAKGESEALRIKGNAINANPKVVELNMIEKWDGQLPTTLITSGNNQSILLNVTK